MYFIWQTAVKSQGFLTPLWYLFENAGRNYKANIPRTLTWTGKRRTLYGLSACLLKYIHLFAVGNKMGKMQLTLKAK